MHPQLNHIMFQYSSAGLRRAGQQARLAVERTIGGTR